MFGASAIDIFRYPHTAHYPMGQPTDDLILKYGQSYSFPSVTDGPPIVKTYNNLIMGGRIYVNSFR